MKQSERIKGKLNGSFDKTFLLFTEGHFSSLNPQRRSNRVSPPLTRFGAVPWPSAVLHVKLLVSAERSHYLWMHVCLLWRDASSDGTGEIAGLNCAVLIPWVECVTGLLKAFLSSPPLPSPPFPSCRHSPHRRAPSGWDSVLFVREPNRNAQHGQWEEPINELTESECDRSELGGAVHVQLKLVNMPLALAT